MSIFTVRAAWRCGRGLALGLSVTLGISATALSAAETAALNQLTKAEQDAGWKLLFDGQSLAGWRGYQKDKPGRGWRIEDGLLIIDGRGGDLITNDQYQDFELQVDWMVASGGNSGIFFRASETEKYIFLSAPEMQILDDAKHRDGKSPLTSAGANYALHPAARGVVRPAGEWNHARLRVAGASVTHWLNGQEIVRYELGSEDWLARKAKSKFAKWQAYGVASKGHIGLQDHGDRVAFRNIKLRVIADE